MVLGPQGPGRVGRRRFFRRWAARRAAHRACCAATLPRRDAASPRTVRFSLAYLTWSRAAHASAGGRARSQRRRAEQRPPGHGPPAARARPRERAAVRVDTGPGGEAWRRRRVSGRPGARRQAPRECGRSMRGVLGSRPRGVVASWSAGAVGSGCRGVLQQHERLRQREDMAQAALAAAEIGGEHVFVNVGDGADGMQCVWLRAAKNAGWCCKPSCSAGERALESRGRGRASARARRLPAGRAAGPIAATAAATRLPTSARLASASAWAAIDTSCSAPNSARVRARRGEADGAHGATAKAVDAARPAGPARSARRATSRSTIRTATKTASTQIADRSASVNSRSQCASPTAPGPRARPPLRTGRAARARRRRRLGPGRGSAIGRRRVRQAVRRWSRPRRHAPGTVGSTAPRAPCHRHVAQRALRVTATARGRAGRARRRAPRARR
jgi:hypothetical protein